LGFDSAEVVFFVPESTGLFIIAPAGLDPLPPVCKPDLLLEPLKRCAKGFPFAQLNANNHSRRLDG
jgi:hypothetical protein